MRVVVFGATGNVGTSFIRAVAGDDAIDSIVGVARRLPETAMPKTEWVQADVSRDDLLPVVKGADCVVHLAWLIQPSRDLATLHGTNVEGSRRVFETVAEAGIGALVYASSVGAYSLGPKDYPVDESWPTEGLVTSFYSRHKVATERMLDSLEAERPELRVVRLRPGLIFKRASASGQRRLFAGPLLPQRLVRPGLIPVVPDLARLRFQCVHSHDIGEAYRLAVTSDARGPFNVAADPVLGPTELAELLGAHRVKMEPETLYKLVKLSYALHLHPTPPGFVDLALQTPIMDTTRARTVLGWRPRHSAGEVLLELLEGIRAGAGIDTPPLEETTPSKRVKELAGGIGHRTPL